MLVAVGRRLLPGGMRLLIGRALAAFRVAMLLPAVPGVFRARILPGLAEGPWPGTGRDLFAVPRLLGMSGVLVGMSHVPLAISGAATHPGSGASIRLARPAGLGHWTLSGPLTVGL